MERITTTERHAELPSKALIKATAQAIRDQVLAVVEAAK